MLQTIALRYREASLWSKAIVLASIGLLPVFAPSMAMAAPAVTERELVSTSAVPDGATDLTWLFDTTADAGQVERIEIEFCDSPLGACGAGTVNGADNTIVAADNIPELPATPTVTIGGPAGFSAPANSATRTNGRSGATSNQITVDITTGFAGASANEASIAIAGFTNDEEANVSYYTRLRIYSTDTPAVPTDMKWEGVFAQSTSQTLTVNARVQERLDFCVGATAVDDGIAATPTDCTTVSGNSVDIGNIENGNTNVSPVQAVNGGSNTNGIAMIRTNAVNGAVVDYRALQNNSSGGLKVASATCNATPSTSGTDQCFNDSPTPGVFAAGTEKFGMVVAGVNCTSTTAYTCSFAGGTYNLVRDADYDGGAAPNNVYTDELSDLVPGSTTYQYAWTSAGTVDRIASSAASSVKVIDDEALILKFAATAGITTPTGSYSVQSDFIATTTF